MRTIWKAVSTMVLFAGVVLLLTACGGGGGGGGGGVVAPSTLSGTAAAGAPIIGTVTIKDSTTPTALTKTVTIEANGNYTVDVADLQAPYMVRADGYVGGNEYHLYSAGTAADVGHTINITPLTDLIVANIAGSVAKTYFDGGNFTGLTATALQTQSDALVAKLQPILTAVGVSGSIDLLRASFSTDHTGLDAVLDVLRVSTDTDTNEATITNIITQQTMTSDMSTGTYDGVLDITIGVATAATDIQMISNGFAQFSALFATSMPSEIDPILRAMFDDATFLQGGQNLASFLSEITTDPSMIGISFQSISIQSMDANTALVGFVVMQNGQQMVDAPETWSMIKKDGAWFMQGDQRIANVNVETRAEYHISSNGSIQSGLNLDIEDRGALGIVSSAVVSGAGLPNGGITLINNIANDYFEIQGQYGGNMYTMTDSQIGSIADTGELYTVKLYDEASTLLATYTEKLNKRPYLVANLSADNFPTISQTTLTQMQSFTGGQAEVQWTLPAGLVNDWLDVWISDDLGNSANYEAHLLPGATSESFTLAAETSAGPFTITQGSLWLSAYDSFGRSLATSTW